MTKSRSVALDITRIVACLMVIIMHSPIPSENAISILNLSLSYYTAPCIGLFFMVSGALLLPTKDDTFTFYKKRFSKIIFPTLFWSIVYIFIGCIEEESFNRIIKSLLSIPFSAQGHGIMWFMYTLAGLYLIAPIISSWLKNASKKEIEFFLLLWLLSTSYPILDLFISTQKGDTSIIYYFSGYIGYFILGYYLNRFPTALSPRKVTGLFVLAAIAPIILKLFNISIDFYKYFWYLSLPVVIMSTAWFVIIRKLTEFIHISHRTANYLTKFSGLSFGIYLSHILIMRYILWHCPFIANIESYILQTFTTIILTLIGATTLCYIIALLPKSEYIIGYKIKKQI